MEERSVKAYEFYRDSTVRFEYFVLGVSGALCAYVGQNLTPRKLDWSPHSLEVAALVILALSVVAGFKRLENIISIERLGHRRLHLFEERGKFVSALGKESGAIQNEETGDVFSPGELERRIKGLDREIPIIGQQSEKASAKANVYYRIRNWLLALGFLGLMLAKILAPYTP